MNPAETVFLKSRVKLNWLLYVSPPRSDGYHDLLTVFQELELGDPMTFERIESPECRLEGFPASIAEDSNLVTRAWTMMRELYPAVGGLQVNITKTIPSGGGLGGGSSNAACTLKAINHLYGLQLSARQLEELGARIGSDVAFFIQGGAASATGRGEILKQEHINARYHIVLLFPREPMSTAEGYRLLDEISRPSPSPHTLSTFLTALCTGQPSCVAELVHNDFEFVAKKFEWYTDARRKLEDAGVLKVLLCGSGSTVAGICTDSQAAQQIALQVGGTPTYTWQTHI